MQFSGSVIKTYQSDAKVKIVKASACGGCRGCFMGKSPKAFTIFAKNNVSAQKGDNVTITLNCSESKLSYIICYLLPVLFGFIGLVIGALTKKEWLMAILFFVMLALSFVVIALLDKYVFAKKCRAQIIDIIV